MLRNLENDQLTALHPALLALQERALGPAHPLVLRRAFGARAEPDAESGACAESDGAGADSDAASGDRADHDADLMDADHDADRADHAADLMDMQPWCSRCLKYVTIVPDEDAPGLWVCPLDCGACWGAY
jgi:hypothetical protein